VAWLARNGDEQRRLVSALAGDRAELERHFQLSWPAEVDLLGGAHWILAALVVRVAAALRLSKMLRQNLRYDYRNKVDTQWAVLMATMFADTHLDLHLLCDLFALYDDGWIETPFMVNMVPSEQVNGHRQRTPILSEVIQFPPLLMAYPHPLRCVYAGELIDATGAVARSNLWTDVQEKTKSQVASFVHVFLCKAGNHRVSLGEVSPQLRRCFDGVFGRTPVFFDGVFGRTPVFCRCFQKTEVSAKLRRLFCWARPKFPKMSSRLHFRFRFHFH